MSAALQLNEDQVDTLFGAYIRTHRNYAGLTLNQVAWKIRMSASRLDALERGRARIGVRKQELLALAEILKLDYANLTNRAMGVL